jgi:DNA-3-methyladenine glycosylase I
LKVPEGTHSAGAGATARCPWCGTDPLYVAYHDTEWGVPCHDERTLFEFLILEGAQAGLSWITILRKRENYRRAYDNFDAASIGNARATLDLYEQGGSLDSLLWAFVDGRPRINRWRSMAEVPAITPEAEALSKELKRRGFRFIGPTVVYAHMQATGMVNDHLVSCPRHAEPGR